MENQVKVTVISPAAQEKAKLRVAAYARVSSDSADQLNSYLAQVDYYTAISGRIRTGSWPTSTRTRAFPA